MKKIKVSTLTDAQLVTAFINISLRQKDALDVDDAKEYGILFKKSDIVRKELRRRGPESIRLLLSLLQHPNVQVRLEAAQELLDIAPAECRAALEKIAVTTVMPQAASARITLDQIDGHFP